MDQGRDLRVGFKAYRGSSLPKLMKEKFYPIVPLSKGISETNAVRYTYTKYKNIAGYIEEQMMDNLDKLRRTKQYTHSSQEWHELNDKHNPKPAIRIPKEN